MRGADCIPRGKIVLIATGFPPGGGGAGVVYHELCKRLEDDVVAMVPVSGAPESGGFDDEQPFIVVRLPFLRPVAATTGPKWLRVLCNVIMIRVVPRVPLAVLLLFELRRLQPKVVCVGGLPGLYWIVPLIRWATRSKVIFYIHGEEIASTTPTGVICRWFYNRSIAALKQADAVVAVSQWTGRRVLESGIASEKLKIIYNGVDHNRFFPGDADGSIQARHSLAGKRVILTVARLDPRKGHETVLRAIPAICREIPNLVYLIVGDGPGRAALEELVRALRIDEHVIFTGEVGEREVPAYYRTCDLFVQPNRRTIDGDDEGFGLVFLEAAACQRAVVGGRSGGVPEAVIDGTTGILVDGHSVEETTAAIIQLLANPELANRMAIEGWLRSRRFNWGDTASRFAALCHQPNMEPKSSHRRAAV